MLLFRFAYGLRAVAPVAIGASRITARLFVSVNLVAVASWGLLLTAAGYLAGSVIEKLAAGFGPELTIAVVIASLGALTIALRRG